MNFGKTVRILRQRRGWSQAQLAAESGVSVRCIQQWEQDRREPQLDGPARVAVALGVSLDELAGLRPAPRKSEK